MTVDAGTRGFFLILTHVLDLAAVALLLGVALGLGLAVLEKVRLRSEDPLASLAFGTVVGLAGLANAFLALGALGLLRGWTLGLVILGAAYLGRRGLEDLPALLGRVPDRLRAGAGGPVPLMWGMVVFGAACLFLLVMGSAPPVDWDSLMYHLQVPAGFLEAGGIVQPRDNLHVSFVGLLHMLYLPLLAAGRVSGPALLNGAMAALLGVALFSMGSRLFPGDGKTPGGAGSLSLGLVWGTTTLLLVAITPRTDVTLALFLLLAHYAFLLALEESGRMAWAGLGAALVGFAAGVKFNALAYGVGLFPLALWAAWRGSRTERGPGEGPEVDAAPLRGMFRAAAFMVAVGLGALAPWLVKNWILLGSPLYPYFADRVVEPWIQALYTASPTAPAPDPALAQTLRGLRAPVDLWGVFFAPGALTAEGEGAFYFPNRLFLLLPLAVLFLRRRWLGWLALPPLLYLALILVAFPSTNLRYLLPAVPALTLVVAYLLLGSLGRYLPHRSAALGALVLASLALAPSVRTARRWLLETKALPHLVGTASTGEYWETHLDPGVRAYAPMIRYVNGTLAEDARILMLFEARGFPLEPDVLQDNKITNWAYLAAVLPEGSCGEAWEADHLLLASAALRYYQQRGLDPEELQWERFEEFAERCLVPIFHVPGYTLFRWGPLPPPSGRIRQGAGDGSPVDGQDPGRILSSIRWSRASRSSSSRRFTAMRSARSPTRKRKMPVPRRRAARITDCTWPRPEPVR